MKKIFRKELLEQRYLRSKSDFSQIESVEQMFNRVANFISDSELIYSSFEDKLKWKDRYFEILSTFRFLPNSPTLMNAGNETSQLSACFVFPFKNNISDFFKLLENVARIHLGGGGTGFNFSLVKDSFNKESELVFNSLAAIRLIDSLTSELRPMAKRRGANMGILNFNDKNIHDFLDLKSNPLSSSLSNFNLSVLISDEDMEHIYSQFYADSDQDLKGVENKIFHVWKKISHNAWSCGDPGLLFLGSINRTNPLSFLGEITATNPCGEVPLFPFESCNLGSLNLVKYFENGKINWELLQQDIFTAVRFLDSVIDVNTYFFSETKEISMANRKMGLGVMGWAHLLILLEIPYNSEEAVTLGSELMKFIHSNSLEASMDLAKERGSFINLNKSIYYPEKILRNATVNSIAPTGSISVLAETSSSIEPLFSLAYSRFFEENTFVFKDFDPIFLKTMKQKKIWNQKLRKQVESTGSIQSSDLPIELKRLFLTANEIEPIWHLKHQKAFQDYTDNAVSKTINLPESTSEKEVSEIFLKAWKMGLKGITVYRNQSKAKQIIRKGFCNSC